MKPHFTIYRTRHSITTTCTTCDEYEVARRDEAIERWQRRHVCCPEKTRPDRTTIRTTTEEKSC